MTVEEVEEILDETESDRILGDDIFLGLQILVKYNKPGKGRVVQAAEHDEIYSIGVEDAIEAGLTPEDVVMLGKLGWRVQEEAFHHFV